MNAATAALLPPNVRYLERDFDSLRARLIELVESVFPDWTEHEVASFGDILLELFAFVGDTLGFYLDAQIRETRIVTATQRRSLIALARLVGYRLPGAQAATATVSLDLDAAMAGDVLIAAGQVLRTQTITSPILFQLLGRGVVVESLRFRVGPVDAPERPPSRSEVRTTPPEVPLPPAVGAVVAQVADPELRDIIAHAAARNLGWQATRLEGLTSAPSGARGPRSAAPESDPPARTTSPRAGSRGKT